MINNMRDFNVSERELGFAALCCFYLALYPHVCILCNSGICTEEHFSVVTDEHSNPYGQNGGKMVHVWAISNNIIAVTNGFDYCNNFTAQLNSGKTSWRTGNIP